MTAVRRGSRRLFLATVPFRQADDHVAVAFARAAHLAEPVDELAREPDPDAAQIVRPWWQESAPPGVVALMAL
jgi:hypothetical protein